MSFTGLSIKAMFRRSAKACDLAPQGWRCNLEAGHDGPCPAYPDRAYAPHCDPSVLHPPGECEYCDRYPEWQEYRQLARIAFTGESAGDDLSPCPSTWFRTPELRDRWFRNGPTALIREEPF